MSASTSDWLNLTAAIDRRPLTIALDASLAEAIETMGTARSSCVLPALNLPIEAVRTGEARASCLLVMQDSQLVGVLGERDAIRAIASSRPLTVTVATVMQPAPALVRSTEHDLLTALSLLRQHKVNFLPIIDEHDRMQGIVTLEAVRQRLPLDELLKSQPLSSVVAPPVVSAAATTSALKLAQMLAEHEVEQIVLMEASEGEARRIISRQDVIQLAGLGVDLTQIEGQTISSSLPCFTPAESTLAAYWQMQQQQTPVALVLEAGQPLGILTATSPLQILDLELIQSTIAQLQQSIAQFEAQKIQLHMPEINSAGQGFESPAYLREQLQCNRLLGGMALRIRQSLNLDEILQTTVDEVRSFLQTDRVLIYRFNPDMSGTVVVESVAAGWQPALGSTIQDTCFAKNYAQSYKNGRTQVVEDIYTAGLTQCHVDILALFDVRASLVIPVLQGEHLWGLLCAYHCAEPRSWRSLEIDLLKQLATHCAIAIQQSELYQQVQSELKEKDILLKEIHHRVKNNLQIISSLLRLQSSYIKEEETLALFKESQNRIRSMALIHEKLYQSKNLARVNFGDYIQDLTANLLRSYVSSSHPIDLTIDAHNVWLNVDTAIPCGLIINELVTNSLKHAFPVAQPSNHVSITVHSTDNKFTLTIHDNGIGLPQTLNFKDTESLGLDLVCTFVEQLEGTIELDRHHGTTFIIKFSELKHTEKN